MTSLASWGGGALAALFGATAVFGVLTGFGAQSVLGDDGSPSREPSATATSVTQPRAADDSADVPGCEVLGGRIPPVLNDPGFLAGVSEAKPDQLLLALGEQAPDIQRFETRESLNDPEGQVRFKDTVVRLTATGRGILVVQRGEEAQPDIARAFASAPRASWVVLVIPQDDDAAGYPAGTLVIRRPAPSEAQAALDPASARFAAAVIAGKQRCGDAATTPVSPVDRSVDQSSTAQPALAFQSVPSSPAPEGSQQ